MDQVIRIENLTKYYNKTIALEDVTIEINRGESVALLGPNGAGKSTLIKCLMGLLDFKGSVSVNNVCVRSNGKLAKSYLAYVPQEPSFYDVKTIEILNFYNSLRKTGKKRIEEVLETVRLVDHRYKLTSELSGGMKQRLSFAIALLSDSPLLVLDEPTSNLDKESRAEILDLTKNLKDRGKTIVFSSHRLEEVYQISNRVVLLQGGKVAKDFPVERLSAELDYEVSLYIYLENFQKDNAANFLKQKGYVIQNTGPDFLVLDIKSNLKIEPIKELLNNNFKIIDFDINDHNIEMN